MVRKHMTLEKYQNSLVRNTQPINIKLITT